SGWDLRVERPRDDARVGMRAGDKVVALVDLRDPGPGGLQALARTVMDHGDLPLIALVPDIGADDPAFRPILQACGERIVSPFNLQQLSQALAAFDQRLPAGGDIGGML